jgi:hypothetical protein
MSVLAKMQPGALSRLKHLIPFLAQKRKEDASLPAHYRYSFYIRTAR